MNKQWAVLDDQGNTINIIVADQEFMDANYAGHYRQAFYWYDSYGWVSENEIPGRSTTLVPPAYTYPPVEGQPYPNYTGVAWVTANYSTPPPPEVIIPPRPTLTMKTFLRRFTAAEREALYDIRQNGTATQKKKLGAFMEYIMDGVETDDEYVVTIVNLMETAGVIAAGRAAEILV